MSQPSAYLTMLRLQRTGVRIWLEAGRLQYSTPGEVSLEAELRGDVERCAAEIAAILSVASRGRAEKPIATSPPGSQQPASFAQQRFLLLDELTTHSSAYNLASSFRMHGALDVRAFTRSLADIIQRHEVLRTRFDPNTSPPTQIVHENDVALKLMDLRLLPETERRDTERRLTSAAAQAPFDLWNGPHIRMLLLHLDSEQWLFVVVMHHIVSDGPSIGIFARELRSHFARRVGRGVARLVAPLEIQYADFARWQHDQVSSELAEKELKFWRGKLHSLPAHRLPTDSPRFNSTQREADSVAVDIDGPRLKRALAKAQSAGLTRFQLLLTALGIALMKYAGSYEIVVGTPVSNRPRQTESLIGPFINTVAIRVRTSASATVGEVAQRVRQETLDALDNANVPFERVVEGTRSARNSATVPLFDVIFALEETPLDIMALDGVGVETELIPERTAKFDLALVLYNRGDDICGSLKFDRSLFRRATADAIATRFVSALDAFVEYGDCALRDLDLLQPDARAQHLALARGPEAPYSLPSLLHLPFEIQAAKAPEKIAVCHGAQQVTYGDLNASANQLAYLLTGLGIGPETIVGIHAERSIEMVRAVLAVLKAGAAYLPLDADQPRERLEFMARDAQVKLVIKQRSLEGDALSGFRTLTLDSDTAVGDAFPRENPCARASSGSACYVSYTSGSTGRPKGVVTEHRAIANNLAWMQHGWPLDERDAMLVKAPFGFDVAVKELMWPLQAGARLVLARPGGQRDLQYLHELMQEHGVTVAHMVPAVLASFLQQRSVHGASSLRILMCGGEALSVDLRDRFCAGHDAVLLHCYGPTEAAIAVTTLEYRRSDAGEAMALGRPIPNAQIYVLDRDLNLLPVGAEGELAIGGQVLARGYLGSGALTAERFVPDPFGGEPGARLYRTGDLGRWREDGLLEYLGRIDRQLKVRGSRIEPAEIETAIRNVPGVRGASVHLNPDRSGEKRLTAYVVMDPGVAAPDVTILRRLLRDRLPEYMLPERIVQLETLPLNDRGKLDVDRLPLAPAQVRGPEAAPGARNDAERVLVEIWCQLLDRDAVGVEESFFDAGGNSLMLPALLDRIEERLGRRVAASQFFAHPTIRELAAYLNGDSLLPSRGTSSQEQQGGGVTSPVTLESDIAVIGMAGRFPGANDIEEYWHNLSTGVESIRLFTDAELVAAGVAAETLRDPSYIKARGAIDGYELFDAEFFGYTAREAEILDPQLRLMLELTKHAFDDAGYEPRRLAPAGIRCAAFVAATRSNYFLNVLQHRADLMRRLGPQALAIATDKSFFATQLAYRLDLTGPAMSVDTACSSALVALHQACLNLACGEADIAIVAAASIDVPMIAGYQYQAGNIASRDGHCRPFDAGATGTIKGCGGAVLVLKPLARALADRDSIRVVIKGTAVNNDGSRKAGYTAPSEAGQAQTIARALARARIEPDTIGLIEAHGTGTPIGDPIELAALHRVFKKGRIAIGSVKANIGHLDAAAGLAGFIKAAAATQRGIIPPVINFDAPNPALELEKGPFFLNREARAWSSTPRRAGVSSFGIGGTNAHVIIEQAPEPAVEVAPSEPHLVMLAARSAERLATMASELAKRLRRSSNPSLADLAFTCATSGSVERRRLAIVAGSIAELAEALERAATACSTDGASEQGQEVRAEFAPLFWLEAERGDPEALVRRLSRSDRHFRQACDRCFAELESAGLGGHQRSIEPDALKRLFAPLGPVFERIQTFVIQYSLAASLIARGLRPARFRAAGVGAVVASVLSGALALDSALRSIASSSWSGASEPLETAADREMIVRLPSGERDFLAALGRAWEAGYDLQWPEFQIGDLPPGAGFRRTSLPSYPFRRRRHWIEAMPKPIQGNGLRRPTELATRLPELWRELLDAPVGPDAPSPDFFAAGGDSLAASQLVRAIREEFQIEVPLAEFFETPTLDALARIAGREYAKRNSSRSDSVARESVEL